MSLHLGGNVRLLSGHNDGKVCGWDPATGKKISEFAGHDQAVLAVAFSPDAAHVVAGSQDGTAGLGRDAQRRRNVFRGHTGPVNAVAFSPDGAYVATAGQDRTARVWRVEGVQAERVFEGQARSFVFCDFATHGQQADGIVTLSEAVAREGARWTGRNQDRSCAFGAFVMPPSGMWERKILGVSWRPCRATVHGWRPWRGRSGMRRWAPRR